MGLLPQLQSITSSTHIKEFAGKTVAVDGYVWLHKGSISCAIDLARGVPTTKYVNFAMERVRMLQHYGVTPYLVFDGDYLPSKAGEEKEREKRREVNKQQGLQLYDLRKFSEAHKTLQKSIDITPIMARHVIEACKAAGISYVVAPYEADAQLYYLEKSGVVDAIASEDSDLLVFGCKTLITKLDRDGSCEAIRRERFTACRELSLAGWTDTEFRHMAILSGCDYLPSIKGMGIKTAHRLLRKHKTVDRVLQSVQFAGSMTVPKGYLEQFRQADLTFLHQRVFCPTKNMVVMCNEPEGPLSEECLVFIGPDVELKIAQGVARGDLDPMTKEPFPEKDLEVAKNLPTFKPPPKYQPPKTPTVIKPSPNTGIKSFFKPKTEPKTPLQPKTANPQLRKVNSAPQRCVSTPAAIKRSVADDIVKAERISKKLRLSVDEEDLQNVKKTGKRSSFFQTPSHRQARRPLSDSAPAGRKNENTKLELERLEDLDDVTSPEPETPASMSKFNRTFTTPTPMQSVKNSAACDESVRKVVQGWKEKYSFQPIPPQSELRTSSSIIQKRRWQSAPSVTNTPQRATTTPGRTPATVRSSAFKANFNVSIHKKFTAKHAQIPHTVDNGNSSGESQDTQDAWPEFVGVGRNSSVNQDLQVEKVSFGQFMFKPSS
ncbi:Rad2 nuclease [Rhizina undulata]